MTGTRDDVLENVVKHSESELYKDPTETLPQSPPSLCKLNHTNDINC